MATKKTFHGTVDDKETRLLLAEWMKAKKLLDDVQALEMGLRMQVVSAIIPDRKPLDSGTFNFQLPKGWAVGIKLGYNITLDQAQVEAIREQLIAEKAPVDTVFGSKWTFINDGYTKLNDDQKEIVNEALTFKTATPAITLSPPPKAKTNG